MDKLTLIPRQWVLFYNFTMFHANNIVTTIQDELRIVRNHKKCFLLLH